MTGLVISLVLGATLAGPLPEGIVCESRQVPVQISRNVRILEHRTHCYQVTDPEREHLEKLKIACDLLITAYGDEEGRARCKDLVDRSDLDP